MYFLFYNLDLTFLLVAEINKICHALLNILFFFQRNASFTLPSYSLFSYFKYSRREFKKGGNSGNNNARHNQKIDNMLYFVFDHYAFGLYVVRELSFAFSA